MSLMRTGLGVAASAKLIFNSNQPRIPYLVSSYGIIETLSRVSNKSTMSRIKSSSSSTDQDATTITTTATATTSSTTTTSSTACTDINNETFVSIDLAAYLDLVQTTLHDIPEGAPSLRVSITKYHRKLMMQTLLGYKLEEKSIFDKRILDRRYEIIHTKLCQFTKNLLLPAMESLLSSKSSSSSTSTTSLSNSETLSSSSFSSSLSNAQFVLSDDFYNTVQSLWKMEPSFNRNPLFYFNRLATGPVYKGSLHSMIEDIVPHLLPEFVTACDGLAGNCHPDILLTFINEMPEGERKEIAKRCLNVNLPAGRLDESKQKESVETEMTMIKYLKENRCHDDNNILLLENVFVDMVRGNTTKKNMTTYIDRIRSKLKYDNTTSVIMTKNDRYKVTSEFDSLIVRMQDGTNCSTNDDDDDNNNDTSVANDNDTNENDESLSQLSNSIVSEIWESKITIHPSSIHDGLIKKLTAWLELIREKDSFLVHERGVAVFNNNSNNNNNNNDDDDNNATIVDDTNNRRRRVFGLFATGIVSPIKAVFQLRTQCFSKKLSSSCTEVEYGLDNGYVQVSKESVSFHLRTLQELLKELNKIFDIIVIIKTDSMDYDMSTHHPSMFLYPSDDISTIDDDDDAVNDDDMEEIEAETNIFDNDDLAEVVKK